MAGNDDVTCPEPLDQCFINNVVNSIDLFYIPCGWISTISLAGSAHCLSCYCGHFVLPCGAKVHKQHYQRSSGREHGAVKQTMALWNYLPWLIHVREPLSSSFTCSREALESFLCSFALQVTEENQAINEGCDYCNL